MARSVAESTPWHDAYRQVAPDPEAWTSLALKVNQLDRAGVSFPREWLAALQIPPLLIIGDSDVVHPEHTVEMFRILGGGVPGDLVGLPPIQLAILPLAPHTSDFWARSTGSLDDHQIPNIHWRDERVVR